MSDRPCESDDARSAAGPRRSVPRPSPDETRLCDTADQVRGGIAHRRTPGGTVDVTGSGIGQTQPNRPPHTTIYRRLRRGTRQKYMRHKLHAMAMP